MSDGEEGYIFVEAMGDPGISPRDALPSSMLTELPDLEADQYLVFRCANRMAAKLASSRAKGRGGWHTSRCDDNHLHRMLREHVEKGDMVDVLNIAGMILVRHESREQRESSLMLGPTGGPGTKAEKIRRMLETHNWTTQTVGCVDGACGD
jgi:hypothetical protein